MKRLLLLLVLVAGTFAFAGCTYNESWAERNRRVAEVYDMDLRGINEDWDHIWLVEKTRTNEWHAHVGQ